ncbi:transporter [Desulfosarcina ovata subsp. sediminis]|uniref:Transporter n=2 Tax=Desulfosarcina TaxID=2299 RepID=A0A5K7ZFJ6_9BACT|nr:efflux RND transporter permease subunit [Desulfosarcina ovata]BBO80938.1 transporter [Desulfosarcina ovata subsp. sediminis]
MNLAEFALRQRVFIGFLAVLCAVAGIISYFELGKLEDPVFTVKSAVVVVLYPGASAAEVERQVTDKVETRLQEMGSLWKLRSLSRPGSAMIFVDLYESYKHGELPQEWDLLRRKVNDVKLELPPAAQIIIVQDEFSEVYGMLFAVYGDGIDYAGLHDYAQELQRRIKAVKGIKKIELHGVRNRVVNVDLRDEELAQWNIPIGKVLNQLTTQNIVQDAGKFALNTERIRLNMSGYFEALDDVRNLTVSGGQSDTGENIIRFGDIADIYLDYEKPAETEARYNGYPAVILAVSPRSNINVVSLGDRMKQVVADYQQELPVGVEIGTITFQPDEVQKSVSGFVINLIESILIVIVVLWLFMGWKSASIVGSTLFLTILCTLLYMLVDEVNLQRVSVGSFILALGMLVDNAIVVTDMFVAKLKKGVDRFDAATDTVRETALPLLGSTVIAIMGASPVFFSITDVGEYAMSVFKILCSSLLLSWLLAMTVTPLMCWKWLRGARAGAEAVRLPKPSRFKKFYLRLIDRNVSHPWTVVLLVMPLLVLTILIGLKLPVNFMPYSDRPLVFLDYWLPNGSMIEQTSADMGKIEKWLLAQPQVKTVGSFIGASAPRFSVTVEPEPHDQSYGQFIIITKDFGSVADLVAVGDKWLGENFPNAEPRFRNLKLATKDKFSIEARFSGPEPQVLHQLADQAKAIMSQHPLTKYVRDDWRQPSRMLEPVVSQEETRKTGINRADIATSLKRATDGHTVGLFRQDDRLVPIKLRSPQINLGNLDSLSVKPAMGVNSVPLGQVVTGFDLKAEESMIWRRNRLPTISAQAGVKQGVIPGKVRAEIKREITAIELPPGYTMEWGGEYYDARRSTVDILNQLPKVFLISVVIMIALFNGVRQPLIILITIPLASTGVIAMHLMASKPFGFMALVGAIALSGMIIKNGVVLLDQIELERQRGQPIKAAVREATFSRTLPISMGALTTLLGMVPLLADRLFDQMAATIIGGLAVATFLSLIIMPALYMLFFRRQGLNLQKGKRR